MKRVLIQSARRYYETICGEHEFTTLEEAIEFAYYGAKELNSDVHMLMIEMEPDKRIYPDVDVIVTVEDWYDQAAVK